MKVLFPGKWQWLPAILVMLLIFAFSSLPGKELPNLGILDLFAKKAAHVLIYAVLAVAFWYALGWRSEKRNLAWLITLLYAISDEFHQSFVPGRHPWWLDVLFFDALGAFLGLWLAGKIPGLGGKNKPMDPMT